MQDRFRFRARDKQLKKYIDISGERLSNFADYTDQFVVEQCTGLKDKSGNLIYEGDIISISHSKYILMVDRFNVLGLVHLDFSDSFDWSEFIKEIWAEGNQDLVEVIGNIHENPELLQGEQK